MLHLGDRIRPEQNKPDLYKSKRDSSSKIAQNKLRQSDLYKSERDSSSKTAQDRPEITARARFV